MHERIQYLVNIKAEGNKSKFAEMIGWKKQHMTRVTKEGGSIGLAVVERILTVFPDVNARWLILGEGSPLLLDLKLHDKMDTLISSIAEIKDNIIKK